MCVEEITVIRGSLKMVPVKTPNRSGTVTDM